MQKMGTKLNHFFAPNKYVAFRRTLKNLNLSDFSMKLIKELESLRNQFGQELERLIKRHQQELDKEGKSAQSDDKKFQKHITQQQDQEIKGFLHQQKKDYKQKKEQLKEACDLLLRSYTSL